MNTNKTTTEEVMAKKILMTLELDAQVNKQIRQIAKKRERSAGFAIRKAINFWLANGAPEEIETPKAEVKKP